MFAPMHNKLVDLKLRYGVTVKKITIPFPSDEKIVFYVDNQGEILVNKQRVFSAFTLPNCNQKKRKGCYKLILNDCTPALNR